MDRSDVDDSIRILSQLLSADPGTHTHTWMTRQLTAGPFVSIKGFSALLKGASTVH